MAMEDNAVADNAVADLALVNGLMHWAKARGAYLNSHVEVYCSPEYGVSLRVKNSSSPRQCPTHHAGNNHNIDSPSAAQAKNVVPWLMPTLPAHSRIVSCPFDLSLSYLNALDVFHGLLAHSTPFPADFFTMVEPKVIGCFFLIQQYLTVDTSHWGPYIRSLPQPDEPEKLATPLYYTEEDLKWLEDTNLLPAVSQRREMWQNEFESGKEILEKCDALKDLSGKWTWDLYKWASTIFSSRSFVSKLIPNEMYGNVLNRPVGDFETWREKIATEGPYPVLFPLVDIANHNPAAKVEWFVDAQAPIKAFSIITDEEIPEGSQIFNNYAPKGNTELLLGYGFCIPGNDDVAIELKCPDEEKLQLWQSQHWNKARPDGRFLYHIRLKPYPATENDARPEPFRVFEDGLISTLAVFVANEREATFMRENPAYSPERNLLSSFSSFMGRNTLCALSLLLEHLKHDSAKIRECRNDLSVPVTKFQQTADLYRTQQIATLGAAITKLTVFLDWLKIRDDKENYTDSEWPNLPIIDICSAFTYLEANHPQVWLATAEAMESAIPLGVDWTAKERGALLVKDCDFREVIRDWDFVALCIWVWCLLIIYFSEDNDLSDGIDRWLADMLHMYRITSDEFDCGEDNPDKDAIAVSIISKIPLDCNGAEIKPSAVKRANRKSPVCQEGQDKCEDFSKKLFNLAMHIVMGEHLMTSITSRGVDLASKPPVPVTSTKEQMVLYMRKPLA